MPPSLRDAAYHDLALLGLPDCDPPTPIMFEVLHQPARDAGVRDGGAHRRRLTRRHTVVFDLPSSREFHVYWLDEACAACTSGRSSAVPASTDDTSGPDRCPRCAPDVLDTLTGVGVFSEGLWLFTGFGASMELGRSHYEEDDQDSFRIIERIAASFWHTADDEWVWP